MRRRPAIEAEVTISESMRSSRKRAQNHDAQVARNRWLEKHTRRDRKRQRNCSCYAQQQAYRRDVGRISRLRNISAECISHSRSLAVQSDRSGLSREDARANENLVLTHTQLLQSISHDNYADTQSRSARTRARCDSAVTTLQFIRRQYTGPISHCILSVPSYEVYACLEQNILFTEAD